MSQKLRHTEKLGDYTQYTFVLGPLATNAFLLTHEKRKEALLIDAPEGILQEITPILDPRNISLKATLLTHGHFDHMGGIEALKVLDAPVYGHSADLHFIENPHSVFFPDISTPPGYLDVHLDAIEQLSLMGLEIRVAYVPGHSEGSVAFILPALKRAYVGDLIFYKTVGRTDLPGANFSVLEQSIRHEIYTLPEELLLFPGHGKRSQVGIEKHQNQFVRGH